MKSLYMWCARRGSNSVEWISTQTEGCFSRKSSGSSVYGIKWNHISFMARSFSACEDSKPAGRISEASFADQLSFSPAVAAGSLIATKSPSVHVWHKVLAAHLGPLVAAVGLARGQRELDGLEVLVRDLRQ